MMVDRSSCVEGGPPMPFQETCRMEERIRMLSEYETGNWNVSELCRRYAVCRDTFYEWRKRRLSGEQDWFADRSHAAPHCAHRTPGGLGGAVGEGTAAV